MGNKSLVTAEKYGPKSVKSSVYTKAFVSLGQTGSLPLTISTSTFILQQHIRLFWSVCSSVLRRRRKRNTKLNLLLSVISSWHTSDSSTLACKQLKIGHPPCFAISMHSRQSEQCTQTKPIQESCAWVWVSSPLKASRHERNGQIIGYFKIFFVFNGSLEAISPLLW